MWQGLPVFLLFVVLEAIAFNKHVLGAAVC